MKLKTSFALIISTTLYGTPFSQTVLAQQPSETNDEAERVLEEVVVTARFRKENIQDIGASIAAYNGDLITREGLLEVQDIALRTVGMEVLDLGPNINDINIRGISNALPTGRGLKALSTTFVDDVAVSGLATTRHGDSSWRVDTALTAPVIEDQLAFRLVGYHQDEGGFIDLPNVGIKDANDFESNGFRGVMLWEPNDKFTLRLSAHVNRLDYGEINQIDPTQDGLDGSLSGDNLYSASRIEATNFDDFDLYALKMAYDFDHITTESITGYFGRNLNTSAENAAITIGFKLLLAGGFGVTDIDTTSLSLSDVEEESFSQEFRFISHYDGPLKFTAGL